MFVLCLLDLDQEPFELGRVRVGIKYRWREPVRESPRIPGSILLNAAIALMDGQANLVSLLAVNYHWLDTFGYEGFGNVVAPRARYPHVLPAPDAHLFRQLHG